MTKVTHTLQVPAKKVGAVLPGAIAVGDAVLELSTERTSNAGSHSRSFVADWTRGRTDGQAHIEIRPLSKVTTEVAVSIARPKGVAGLLWPRASRQRLAELFAQALAYEVETRSIEGASAFDVRRTSPELVKARIA